MSCPTPVEYCITAGQAFAEPDLLYTEPDEITPIDITGATARMDLRESVGGELADSFAAVIDGPSGAIQFAMTPAETAALLVDGTNERWLVFDVRLIPADGAVEYLAAGSVRIKRPVTED